MILTIEHILDLIDAVPSNVPFDYVKTNNKTKAKLISVKKSEHRVEMGRLSYENDVIKSEDSSSLTEDNLRMLSLNIKEGRPFSIDKIFNNGGNMRSVCEAILARTSEFYKVMVKRNKNLVWLPGHPHNVGEIKEITFEELKSFTTSFVSFDLMDDNIKKYVTAIRTKPFLLLAGISGTGKSRIVRQLARACDTLDEDPKSVQKPANFEMVQVKPNWHDSSELIGYVSRIDGEKFIAGDFLKFIVKAWYNQEVPFFLCLDEMNLAPVEQYFAEYLSVIESRKLQEDGKTILTDPIIKPEYEKDIDENKGEKILKPWFETLIKELLADCPDDLQFGLYNQFKDEGISIPQNLIVIGTVNMDETTYSFSRKVLDRAMTIEMNEVNLLGGLTDEDYDDVGEINPEQILADSVEGKDVYADNMDVCNEVITNYLQPVNDVLEGTPFKIAYRTRNEFLVYVINSIRLNSDKEPKSVIANALDEVTGMKILSRIEGDETKVSKAFLDKLKTAITDGFKKFVDTDYSGIKEEGKTYSSSLAKLKSMIAKLDTGYTSFWD